MPAASRATPRMPVVSSLLARICVWCCALLYTSVVVYAGCAITPDSNGHVDIPSSWTSIGSNAFYQCTSLTSVTIGDSVTAIAYSAFHTCTSLTSVTIGDSVTAIAGSAFFACTSLTSVTIPDSVTTIGTAAFCRCSSLTSVTIPDSVTTIGASLFSSCSSLTSVTIPDSVTTIRYFAFKGCTALVSVTIGDSVTFIDHYAFSGCTSLTSVTIPDRVTTIGDRAFEDCSNLTSVTILSNSHLDIGRSGFQGCSNLQNMTVHTSNNITFGSAALDDSEKLKSIVFKDTMTSIIGLPLFMMNQYRCKEGEQCECQNGYGNYLGATMPGYFNCLPCSPGFSGNGTQSACSPCKRGTYADSSTQPVCTQCDPGTYSTVQGATSDTTCKKCRRGEYAPSPGSETCIDCPPGTFCNGTGLAIYKECAVGRYTDVKSRWSCKACPPGQYQNSTGSAKCIYCPTGKFLDGEGANSTSQCLPCSAGTYGDKVGLPQCLSCPTGQVQPAKGQALCKECTLEGKIKTNNEAHTLCIDNEALKSSSVVEAMFTKGVGLYLAFGIGALFVGLAAAMHHTKTGFSATVEQDKKLGALELAQVLLKSAMPGFSFGSEVVLILGMMVESPGLGQTMLVFRLLHPCTVIVLTLATFVANDAYLPAFLGKIVRDSTLSRVFCRRKVPPMCLLLLASACDVTMLQLMPWVDSKFYSESIGYPSLDLMLVCMVVKTVQALVSVICQSFFLFEDNDLSDPLMSDQAKGLFGMSIILSSFTSIMGLMMLFGKWALLHDIDKADHEVQRKPALLSIASMFKDKDDGDDDIPQKTSFTGENPMHSSAIAQMEQQSVEVASLKEANASLTEENASFKQELQAKDRELEEQRREIEQLGLQQQPVLNL